MKNVWKKVNNSVKTSENAWKNMKMEKFIIKHHDLSKKCKKNEKKVTHGEA